jgi:hypothetical protein
MKDGELLSTNSGWENNWVLETANPVHCKCSTQHIQIELYKTRWVELFFGTIKTYNQGCIYNFFMDTLKIVQIVYTNIGIQYLLVPFHV